MKGGIEIEIEIQDELEHEFELELEPGGEVCAKRRGKLAVLSMQYAVFGKQ